MGHSHLTTLVSTFLPVDDTTENLLLELLLLNGRAVILLLGFFLILRFVKGSAATRHFLAAIALLCVALLPLSSRLIPAFDIAIETPGSEQVGIAAIGYFPVVGSREGHAGAFTLDVFYPACLAIYFLGVFFILAKILLGNLKVFLLVKICRPVRQSNWLRIAEEYRENLGIRRKVDLRYSDLNASPSTCGAFRPVILLPRSALQWPDKLIQSTILHELAHIKRYDWLVQQITRCICAVYWANPLCWIAARQIFSGAETACDDIAINSGVKNIHYARNLVDVAEQTLRYQSCRLVAPAMASREKHSQLGDRILAALNGQACRTPLTKAQTALILFAFAGLLMPLASVRANFIETPAARESVTGNAEPATRNPPPEPVTATDHSAAIPVEPVIRDTTGGKPGPAPVDRLSTLKRVLRDTRIPPARHIAFAPPQDIDNAFEYEMDFTLRDKDIPLRAAVDPQERKTGLKSAARLLKKYLGRTPATNQAYADDIAPGNHISGPFRRDLVVPKYPRRAQYRGIEGKITVEYSVGTGGTVVEAKVVSADPSGVFEREVLKAIKNSTFHPRKIDGNPVTARGLTETYIFVLES